MFTLNRKFAVNHIPVFAITSVPVCINFGFQLFKFYFLYSFFNHFNSVFIQYFHYFSFDQQWTLFC